MYASAASFISLRPLRAVQLVITYIHGHFQAIFTTYAAVAKVYNGVVLRR